MVAPNVRVGCALLAMAILVAVAVRGWSASLTSDVKLAVEMCALVLSWIGAFRSLLRLSSVALGSLSLVFFVRPGAISRKVISL